jgi:hypothetical protein
MSDKLISQYDEKIPASTDLVLVDDGSGFYNSAQAGNFPGGGGSGGTSLSTPTLTATPASSSQINLSWSNVANESSYELQRSPNGTTGWTTINSPAANATSYNNTGLTASTTYYYRIRAIGDGVTYLNSAYSSVQSAATSGSGATPLSTPTLTASVISSTQIDLSWTNVANESSYRLEWSPNGSSGWTQIGGTIAANTTTYSHTGLTPSTAYYYRVTAVGDGVTYSDSGYGTDNDTTSAAGPSLENLTFTAANVGLSQTSNVWTGANVAADFENKGLDAKKIASGTDGYIVVQYKADALGCVIGFNLSNANDDYPAYECGLYLTAANVYTVNSGSLGAYGAPTVDRYYRISRTGSTIKLQWATSDAPGATWTDIATYGTSSSADLFICMAIDEKNGDGKCYYPKVYNGV